VNEIADHSYRLETSVEALEKFQPPPPEPPAAERRRAEPARDRAHDRGHLNRHDGGDAAGERGLISAATSAAVDSAFNTLAQTVLVQNGRTLEDLVREMLRPMLKAWLDDNLPSLVERLVRAEIERVSRGRG
jgi:cell pole-organizing protein PopZ